MTRSGSVTFIFMLACSVSVLSAQNSGSISATPSTASKPSIVTLNFNAAVLGTAEAQRALGGLQKKYSLQEQHLQKLNDDIEASKKSLSDGAAKLTEADKSQRLRELDSKEKQLQREAEDFKNDSQIDSQQVFQQVGQKVVSFFAGILKAACVLCCAGTGH